MVDETRRKRIEWRNDQYEPEREMKKTWSVNFIEDEGAKMIGEALKTNTTLTELNLRGNDINGRNETW